MSLTSRHLLTAAVNYFDGVIGKQKKVVELELFEKKLYYAIFKINMIDGRSLNVYVADVYALTAADILEIKSKFENVNCVVVVSNWNHYTTEAVRVGESMGIKVYTLKEFMKAINYI